MAAPAGADRGKALGVWSALAGAGSALGVILGGVLTFHELGGAVGVAVLSSAAGAGLVMAHLGSHDFARAFTVGAVGAAVCLAIAVVLVPAAWIGRV